MSLVVVEREGGVGVVLMNRPDALNALSSELMDAVVGALEEQDVDESIRCIVLGGNERAFAAGADVGELAAATPIELYENRRIGRWDAIRALRTPLVAAVSGYCLGGGCELAMACDLIVASETAQFGQPEINLGILPGAGGTQRLPRAVGKALAMDVILTGRFLSAGEALRAGLVARVVAREAWLDEAKRVSERIAGEENIDVAWERIWNIQPILFDDGLIELADEAIREVAPTSHRLPSGPLHDAAEVARAGIPTVMLFVQSLRGLSHTKLEDTKPEHLELSVRALDSLASRTLAQLAG